MERNATTTKSKGMKPSTDDAKIDVATTREGREAQIAAMVASFDQAPVYQQFTPFDGGDNDNDAPGRDIKASKISSLLKREKLKIIRNEHELPITSSIFLSPDSNSFTSSDGTNTPLQANSAVSTLCFEPSGSRLLAGHRDGTLRFYDFHGMQPTVSSSSSFPSNQKIYSPFRVVEVGSDSTDTTGRHLLTDVNPSPSGAQWIVGTTSAQPKILDREGRTTLFHFCKGDTYITDASNTKGHTASVTGAVFHPLVKDVCWTTGLDGSIRRWDVSGKGKTQFQKLVCEKILGKCKNDKGQRTQVVSSLGVHPNGRKLVVGTACGSIQIWNSLGGCGSRPLGAVFGAHGPAKPVTFVIFSSNGATIATRSEADDVVKVWDAAQMERSSSSTRGKFRVGRGKDKEHPPLLLLAICRGLPALNDSANCAFGPDGKVICAGSSVERRIGESISESSLSMGKIKFYRLPKGEKRSKSTKEHGSKSVLTMTTASLDPIVELDVAPGASVLRVAWHPKLNQIAVGTSNGIIQVLFNPQLSKRGALLPTSRLIRSSDGLSDLLRSRAPTGSAALLTSSSMNNNIINPNALPLFRGEPRSTRRSKERDRKDPMKTKLPEPPVSGGIKVGGKIGGGMSFTQFVVDSTDLAKNKNIAGKDPREELFKYSEGKSFVSRAYQGDVQRILADKTVEEEEHEIKANKRKKFSH